jgi:hypothetical protein
MDGIALVGANAAHVHSPLSALFSAPIITGPTGKSSIFPVFFGNNFFGGGPRAFVCLLVGQTESILNVSEKYRLLLVFYSCISHYIVLQ